MRKSNLILRLSLALFLVTLAQAPTLAGAQSQTQERTTFQPTDMSAITEMINDYFVAFTAKDYKALPNFFQAPFLAVGAQPEMIGTLDAVIERYHHIRDPLDGTDYAVSKAEEIHITALSGQAALANIHWLRYKKNGLLLSEGAEFMMVSKSSGSWKICGSMGQGLSEFGKLY
jgi:ketosteroid isomerase-like protein